MKRTDFESGALVLTASGTVGSFDPALATLVGRNFRAGEPFSFRDLFNPCDVEKVEAAFAEAVGNGLARDDMCAFLVRASGELAPVTVSVRPLTADDREIAGAVVFVRSAKRRERGGGPSAEPVFRIEEASDSGGALLEALPEGVFTIDTSWRISSFNKMAEEITGFSKEKVVGKRCRDIFRSDVCDEGCPLRSALENGLACIDQDVRIIDKDGGKQTILVNAGVLRNEQGEVVGAVETFRPLTGVFCIRRGSFDEFVFDNIVGRSVAMRGIFSMLPDVAASDANVLLCGESGTGKDLFANTIHNHSPRRNAPFVAVNCAALAESLLESELFGHEKASFTGAETARKGRFELAKNGTLFLDEIGELEPRLQIKLRVLEQREFERVGGTKPLSMDARIVSATNRDLKEAMGKGDFREDFYFRLRTVPITIPPLRDRKEDIPLLVDFFIRRLNFHTRKCVRGVSPSVMRFFTDYDWPGNVRELQRTLEYAYVFVKGSVVQFRNLPPREEFGGGRAASSGEVAAKRDPVGRETILRAIERSGGRRGEAARLLGISRTSLWRRMKQHDLL